MENISFRGFKSVCYRCEVTSVATLLSLCFYSRKSSQNPHSQSYYFFRLLVNGIPYHRQICHVLEEPRLFYPIAEDQRPIMKTNPMTMDEDCVNIKKLRYQLKCLLCCCFKLLFIQLFICLHV